MLTNLVHGGWLPREYEFENADVSNTRHHQTRKARSSNCACTDNTCCRYIIAPCRRGGHQRSCLRAHHPRGFGHHVKHLTILRESPKPSRRLRRDQMDQTARYTRFPNLFSTVKSKQAQGTLQSQWPLLLPQELLILSWAALLQSYTGIAEPVFSFDGKAIQVDVLCGSWSEVQVEDALGQADHHTSITLNKVRFRKRDPPAVELIHT